MAMSEWADGFRLSEYRCSAGPGDPVFEECHSLPLVALVLDGRFTYHGPHGARLAEAGSLLLANAGLSYACSHEDSCGDCCMVLQYDPELFAEAAASKAGSSRFTFPGSTMAADESLLPLLLMAERGDKDAPLILLESILRSQSGLADNTVQPNSRERHAIRAALDLIEANLAEPMCLDRLSRAAGMSKYHFIRCFTRVMGSTPYRHLLARRMDRAARQLAKTRQPVTDVAFDCGFGDLSTFNARFRTTFGMTPSTWRQSVN